MRTKLGARPRPTFAGSARRAQIVAVAIDVLADDGYRNASMAAIAHRGGLSSTGLITYHFANKAELVAQVVNEVVGAMGAFMAQRMGGEGDPASRLRSYIAGNIEFIGNNPRQMKALLEVFLNGGMEIDPAEQQAALSLLEHILQEGQAAGQFRNFDVAVVASVVQRAIEGLPFLLQSYPDLDPAVYSAELVEFVDRATHGQT